MLADLQRLTQANMAEDIDRFVAALERRPDPPRGLLDARRYGHRAASRRLSVALDDAVGDQLERDALALGSAGSAGLRRRRPARAPAPAPPRARRSRRSARTARAASSGVAHRRAGRAPRSHGSRSRARISGSVTVPSSRSAPRGLPVRSGGPGDVEHVVEQLEGEPDPLAERAERGAVAAARTARPARRRPGTAPPSSAGSARGSARRDDRVARRRRAASARRPPARSSPARGSAPPRPSRRPASSANARENSRSPVAVAASRPPAATTVGRPRRSDEPSSTSSWTSVAAWTSSTATAAAQRARRSQAAEPRRRGHTSSGRSRLPPAAIVSPGVVGRASARDRPPASSIRSSTAAISRGRRARRPAVGPTACEPRLHLSARSLRHRRRRAGR